MTPVTPHAAGPRYWGRPAAYAAAGALIALLLAVAVWAGNLRLAPPAGSGEAAQPAGVAGAPPSAPPDDPTAGYRYTRSEGASLATVATSGRPAYSALVPRTREIWIAPDGSGRIREAAGEPSFLGERDRSRWQAAGSPPLAFTTNRDFGPGGLSARAEELARLPTDPRQLAVALRQRATRPGGPPVDAAMFVLVGDLLRETVAPPELRAALYAVAAGIPGVESTGSVTDRAGRRGVAVAMTSGHSGAAMRQVLVFDSATAALLGEETVLLERLDSVDAAPPAVIGHRVYLESRIVPALP